VAQESGKHADLKKSNNGHPSPGWPFSNPLALLSKNLTGYRLWLRWPSVLSQLHRADQPQSEPLQESSRCERPACLQVWPASIQVESVRQHIKCVAHHLLRVLAKLPIEAGIVVCVDAAFESSGSDGSIKEPRRDTQRANPIPSAPFSANLVALALHLIGPCRDRNELLLTSLVKSSRH
jgi:hypothetical protein